MTLELNCVMLAGEEHAMSLLAEEGKLICIVGGNAKRRTRWLHAMMGFETPVSGFVSIDGEPLSPRNIVHLRQSMAFVPDRLDTVGTIVTYEPPTVADMFALRRNRRKVRAARKEDISTLLDEECQRTGATGDKALLLAAAVLRCCPVLLVDNPSGASARYLQQLAHEKGMTVISATDDALVMGRADMIVKIEN